jgi:hypothetical protein
MKATFAVAAIFSVTTSFGQWSPSNTGVPYYRPVAPIVPAPPPPAQYSPLPQQTPVYVPPSQQSLPEDAGPNKAQRFAALCDAATRPPTFTFLSPKRAKAKNGKMATRIGEIAFVRRGNDLRAADVRTMLQQLNAELLSSREDHIEFDFYRVRLLVGR